MRDARRPRPGRLLLLAGAADVLTVGLARGATTGARWFWALAGIGLVVALWRGHRWAWTVLALGAAFGTVVLGVTALAPDAHGSHRLAALLALGELAVLLSPPVRAWAAAPQPDRIDPPAVLSA